MSQRSAFAARATLTCRSHTRRAREQSQALAKAENATKNVEARLKAAEAKAEVCSAFLISASDSS